jgi:S1-C subfamily serine protease
MVSRVLMFVLGWALVIGSSAVVCAQDDVSQRDDSIERTAERLLQATVTVRIISTAADKPVDPRQESPAKPADVTVCSGTSLGDGLILTFGRLASPVATQTTQFQYRVTLSDGAQADAQPRVVDGYSGLVLLEIEKTGLASLSIAKDLPKIGGTVLTAAAAGIEQPLVSRGILSGVDRVVGGANLPPMIQCDVSTTDASTGAAIVDSQGALLGIIAATEAPGQKFGWTYAVPTRFVKRVLDARVKDRLVVLVRRRPTVGLELGPGKVEGTVRVNRVAPGGPAEKAGIRTGDLMLEAEGRKIRSAYQVVAQILKRQPGEKLRLVVGRETESREVEVTLGGLAGVVTAQPGDGQVLVGPQINLRVAGPNQIEVRSRHGVAEVAVDPQVDARASFELNLLRRQLAAYQNVIVALQDELKLRKDRENAAALQLEQLRKDVAELKAQMEAAR